MANIRETIEFELELDRFGLVFIEATGETCQHDIEHQFSPFVEDYQILDDNMSNIEDKLSDDEMEWIMRQIKSRLEEELNYASY